MRIKGIAATLTLVLIAGIAALALGVGPTSVLASDARNGRLQVTKDC